MAGQTGSLSCSAGNIDSVLCAGSFDCGCCQRRKKDIGKINWLFSKNVLTARLESVILTELSRRIVSSEQTIWKVLKKTKKVVDKEMKMW